uniref:hypothetical protein n=1 Tax=Paracoccus sp. TaxID=267 RepID=UPI00321F705A
MLSVIRPIDVVVGAALLQAGSPALEEPWMRQAHAPGDSTGPPKFDSSAGILSLLEYPAYAKSRHY